MWPRPELLSPAGDWDCVRAAVANGANAVYFGLTRFNARLRARNFTEQDLPELMAFLHRHHVRGFVTFNTLIFTDELRDAEAQLRLLAGAGVDAIIVQDLGLARLSQAITPTLEVHASTQMTVTSPEGLAMVKQLGIARAVLARELSLREIQRFQAAEVPVEVFVHGALCVAYSGQCLTSESLGQRSANRGECAQACRLPYELVVDGQKRDLGARRYLLSPQDLAGIDELPELIRLGVASFKIEGRLKSAEYVAAVTGIYRRAIDAACARLDAEQPAVAVNATDRYALEMTFSRGLFSGWLHGVNHQRLVDGRFGKKRGVYLGQVRKVGPGFVEIAADAPVKPGDGVVFGNPENTDHEEGGRVFAVADGRLSFGNGKVDFHRIRTGDDVWKTNDPALDRELRQTFADEPDPPRLPVHLSLTARPGEPLRLSAAAGGCTVTVASAEPLAPARKSPLTVEKARAQFARLGDTPYTMGEFRCDLNGEPFAPPSLLNELRREAVSQLERARAAAQVNPSLPSPTHRLEEWLVPARPEPFVPELILLCRTTAQVAAAADAGVETVYVDFEDVRRYREIVAEFGHRVALFLATPRIQKPGETGFFRLIEHAAPCGVLVRNLGAISFFRGKGFRLHGDFSLNVANPVTASFLLAQGLDQLSVSCDLNLPQLLSLLAYKPADKFELTLHQHMPMFHMEHCVFAAFLSEGKDHTDCGRPCDRHRVRLRDRVGAEHPVLADVGCRNTVFNARAQTGAAFFSSLRGAGLRRFRIECLDETAVETQHLIREYRRLLNGELSGEGLWRRLQVQSQLGVTRGTLA
ncbi:MAG TPA: U32 family peptidase [Chthoniobacterales bacterium]